MPVKKILRTSCLLFLTIVLLAGCQKNRGLDSQGPDKEDILAMVNGEPITMEDLDNERDLSPLPKHSSAARAVQDINQALFEQLVERKLLLQEARRRHIQVSPEEVQDEIRGSAGNLSLNQLHRFLSDQGEDVQEWQKRLSEELLINKLLQELTKKITAVSAAEEKDYYAKHVSTEFREPAKVKVRQILVRSERKAEAVLKELKKKADFGDLAREKSLAPDAKKGGDWGYCSYDDLPAPLAQVIFDLDPGEVSKPVKSAYGYHIFLAEARRNARVLTFEEAQDTIKQKLLNEKKNALIEKFLTELPKNAKIEMLKPL